MTSPPLTEPRACQTPTLAPGAICQTETSRVTPSGHPVVGSKAQVSMESLTKRTEPSTNATLTPPGWKLEAPLAYAPAASSWRKFDTFFWGLTGQKWV